jgi:PPOX class probable F420-dependent enzyme
LSEVWFLKEDDDSVAISLNTSRQKTKNLRADPLCSVLILDVANPYRYVELRGDAELSADDDYAFAARVGHKYSSDLRQHDAPGDGRVIVRVRPTRVRAVDMNG